MTNQAIATDATEIHYCVIDRDSGERYSTTSSTSRSRTERERNRIALSDGKFVCLGIGRIDPDARSPTSPRPREPGDRRLPVRRDHWPARCRADRHPDQQLSQPLTGDRMTTHIPNGTLVTLPDGTRAAAYNEPGGTYRTAQHNPVTRGVRVDVGWRREQLTVVETGGAA